MAILIKGHFEAKPTNLARDCEGIPRWSTKLRR